MTDRQQGDRLHPGARPGRGERAVIRKTATGATIEYASGRRVSLWAFALDEPVMTAALRHARRDGAGYVVIESDTLPDPGSSPN